MPRARQPSGRLFRRYAGCLYPPARERQPRQPPIVSGNFFQEFQECNLRLRNRRTLGYYRYPPVLPSDELIFKTQQHCQQILAENGYAQYEVSAYSLTGKQCRHNLNYWQFGDYLGIGAGAHGKLSLTLPQNIIRTQKNKHPECYAQPNDFIENEIELSELPLEFLMNQLRLKQGFTLAYYQIATGLDATTLEPALSDCVKTGLLEKCENIYRCTDHGWNFLDNVLQKFVP